MDTEPVAQPVPRRHRSVTPWVFGLLIVAAAIGYMTWRNTHHEPTVPRGPIWRLYYTVTQVKDGESPEPPVLFSVSRDGSDIQKAPHPGGQAYYYYVAVSSDGQMVVYTDGTDIERELFVSKLDGSGAVKVGETPMGDIRSVCFSQDNRQLAYARYNVGVEDNPSADLYLANTDGTGIRKVAASAADEDPLGFSADGRRLFYQRVKEGSRTLQAFNIVTGRTHPATAADIPNRLAPATNYLVKTTSTGRTITVIGAEGVADEEAETVDDLYLLPPGTHRIHVTRGSEIAVLGWVRE